MLLTALNYLLVIGYTRLSASHNLPIFYCNSQSLPTMSVVESHKAPSTSLIVQFLIDQQLNNEDNKKTHTHGGSTQ